MVLAYFEPHEEYSWDRLDTISGKVGDRWTWPMASMLWLDDRGYKVTDYTLFDFERFGEEGGAYLIEWYGEEMGRAQIAHGNIPGEMRYAKEYVRRATIHKTLPTTKDVRAELARGALVMCGLNAYALDDEVGYEGHAILVKGFDAHTLLLHDPGSPPHANRVVDDARFERAWGYPTASAQFMLVIQK